MTTGAINGDRLLDFHFCVASHTLSVIGRHQTRLRQIILIKRFAMAAAAAGWLRQRRAVVVTSFTEGIFIPVEGAGQTAVFDFTQNRIDDFPMG